MFQSTTFLNNRRHLIAIAARDANARLRAAVVEQRCEREQAMGQTVEIQLELRSDTALSLRLPNTHRLNTWQLFST